MQRSEFLEMIENYGPANQQAVKEVSELITIFPYFQSAYSLLLKGLQNTSDVKFENQLRTSAMHIANREVLYYFLKKEPVAMHMSNIEPEEKKTFQDVVDTTDNQQTVIESGKSSADLISEIERLSSDFVNDDSQDDHSKVIEEVLTSNDLNASILIIDEESGEIDGKITYMDPGFSLPGNSDLLELDQDEPVSPQQDLLQEKAGNGTEEHPEKVTMKDLQTALIDKFIESNPRIEPVREPADKPLIDISIPYTEGADGFVTETLARIYIGQGYYSKAINIYEKLCLKYPEKSTYFAAQIEKVKELLKK